MPKNIVTTSAPSRYLVVIQVSNLPGKCPPNDKTPPLIPADLIVAPKDTPSNSWYLSSFNTPVPFVKLSPMQMIFLPLK